jgi:hypothetical protein
MAKKKKITQEVPKLGQINNFADTVVSINLKKASFWAVGKTDNGFKIELNATQWAGRIPDNLTESEVALVDKAIGSNIIIIGKKYIPPIDKETGVKDKYLKLCMASPCTAEAKQPFIDLVRKKKEGGWTALGVLSYVKSKDAETRSRSDWQVFLQDGINAYDGPVKLVEDFTDDADNYEVVIDPVTKTIVSDTRKEDGQFNIPVGVVPSLDEQEKREKLLDKHFE